MSGAKKKYILNTVSVKLGCGSCTRLSAAVFRRPKPPKHRRPPPQRRQNPAAHYSSSSSCDTTFSAAVDTPPVCYSSESTAATEPDVRSSRAVQGFGRIGGESVAVEKDSDDPYLDFRRSMLQMIMEKELYSKDELKELLNCFLQLNSPYYHGTIIRAFTEIWNGVEYSHGF
ncbi:hypothetical protein ACP275_12G156800 [Erythranthe tilingii]